MRVCMVACASYYTDARIKAYVESLIERNAEVDVLVLREPGKSGIETAGALRVFYQTAQYRGDSRIRYILSYLLFFAVTFLRLSWLSLRHRYDAVHVHNMPNVLVFTALVPKLRGAQILLDVHDLMPANYMTKFDATADHPMVRMLVLEQRISALGANYVLCADHLQMEFLRDICHIPGRKLKVFLNLPNERIFQRVKGERATGTLRLVYHGTIAKRLGIDIIVRAVAKASQEIPVHLSVYGAGDFLPDVRQLVDELRLGECVYISGAFFAVEKVPEIVSAMDAGIVGNRRTLACEKFMLPVKLLEYVYLGIPVIAPRLQIIQSYFDEDMLKYYQPEDVDGMARCIVDLGRSVAERGRVAERALTFYERRNWRRQAADYVALLGKERGQAGREAGALGRN